MDYKKEMLGFAWSFLKREDHLLRVRQSTHPPTHLSLPLISPPTHPPTRTPQHLIRIASFSSIFLAT